MDAAIDAMHPMGFADKLVQGTVRDLLKVGIFFVCFICSLFLECKNINYMTWAFCSGLWWEWWMAIYRRKFILTSYWNDPWKNKGSTRGGKFFSLYAWFLLLLVCCQENEILNRGFFFNRLVSGKSVSFIEPMHIWLN